MIQVPYKEIEKGTLRALIEEFVTREGTDYGINEVSLEKKVKDVFQQLQQGTALILFDENSQSVTIVSKDQFVSISD